MLKKVVVLVLLLPSICLAQYSIKGTFSPPEDYKLALLYKVTPTLSKYIANANIKKDGSFEFKLDSTATKGMYRVVYAIPQEDYNFDVIYNKKEDVVLSFSAEQGLKFIKSSENKLIDSYTNSMSLFIQNISNYYKQQNKDTTALNNIFKNQKATQLNYEKLAKDMIALHFIKASRPYIPNKYQPVKVYRQNVKKHYFDNIDFNNKILQSSSFIEERMLNYVFGTSDDKLNKVANYKTNVDAFCKAIADIPIEVKRILLLDLWVQMKDLGFESVSNYISEAYLIDIAITLNDEELSKQLLALINASVGKVAPDFSWHAKKNNVIVSRKLRELINSKNYVIVFWSTVSEISQVYNFVKANNKGGLTVIAIGLDEDYAAWNKLIKKYPEFIHVYGKGKWDNKIVNSYGVKATTTFFVLDKDKKITAKYESFDDFKAFCEDKKGLW